MRRTIFAGLALALSLAAPTICAPAPFESGAFVVEQISDQGPPLIFLPGLASGSWVWTETAQRLRGKYAVYLLTLPGFDGRKPVAGTTLETLARDLQAMIDERHVVHPVLVGHSLGGTLSLAFAADHSTSIAGVIAVDGLPVFPGTETFAGDRGVLAKGAREQIASQTKEQFAAYQQTYMKQVGSIDPAIAAKLAEHSGRSDIGATAEFAAQILALDLRPRLVDIQVPVVEISPFNAADFAAMGVDEAGKTGYYRALLGGVKRLDVVSISPARHFVMFDQPEKFADALDAALAGMLGSPK